MSVPTPGGRGRPGLRIHRTPSLTAGEVTTKAGIPVTTPARTLLDLAAALEERELHRALDQAEILELTYHRTRAAFERDRLRDQQLAVAGYRVLRFTHRQIDEDPAAVARTLSHITRP